MSPQEAQYPTKAHSAYSNISETQENYLKINFMKIIEVIKEEMNKPLEEIQENAKNR